MLTVSIGERFRTAADEWADARLTDSNEALEVKVEQALLEIEHLVSGAKEVEFELDGDEIRYEPTAELSALLSEQADRTGLDESALLRLHVDLFARAFLDSDEQRPPGAPPRDR